MSLFCYWIILGYDDVAVFAYLRGRERRIIIIEITMHLCISVCAFLEIFHQWPSSSYC